ncbi:hypothetical protein RUMHYD_02651 [Blautia hydrogenotrophica DSM 10507]|uniref:Uncharacterized protein n=1 Tax=Blautia hydrogenotrophica (strain DSM 10507 / JCM 14656 / S5a33) TaxID=476272 RepID=C0CP50_BLAHS|nr:hypothetical protein RUMHYD_02651 [Blautia hydrogenotrophica DSM 10507]
MKIFKTPEKGTVYSDQWREEEIGVEQTDLCPKRVPLRLQNVYIAQVVPGSQQGGNDGNQKKGGPDQRALALHSLTVDDFHKHSRFLLT